MIGMIMRIKSREKSLPLPLTLLLHRHNARQGRRASPATLVSTKISMSKKETPEVVDITVK
jgi:hypothetical protein